MLGGRHSGQDQALEQARDSVLLYGESIGCKLLNFTVPRRTLCGVRAKQICRHAVGIASFLSVATTLEA